MHKDKLWNPVHLWTFCPQIYDILSAHAKYHTYIYLIFEIGVDIKEVQEMVEGHLKEMIFKHFDPKKADSIFSDEGAVSDDNC